MKATELAKKAKEVTKKKTLYVFGAFGAPLNDVGKSRYANNCDYNQKTARKVKIMSATADTFAFDCSGLIKGLLWGWDSDTSARNGGAKYNSNGVNDINADGMIKKCSDVSTDFSKIQVGEVVWMKGHIGVYIGNGLAVESTPIWQDGVQITAVHNIGQKAGYNGRTWTKHGKLPYVTYEVEEEPVAEENTVAINLSVLQKGSEGEQVRALQRMLHSMGYALGSKNPIDGNFGSKTDAAVRKFQEKNGLYVDGIVGKKTWNKLLKG